LHQQALDTLTPSGRALFGMLGVFSEFERSSTGRVVPTPFPIDRIRAALDDGRGVRETARSLKVSAAEVSDVRRMSAAAIDLHP
jgi:hypothetical protein